MASPFQQAAFTVGEVGPALFGRQDLARTHLGASTMRNMLVRYTGGAMSRGGTSFVGFSKQTGRMYAPRMVPFQFNIHQGLALEFGHQYMRVIQNGQFVTEAALSITGVSQADPAVVTTAGALGAASAVAITSGVTRSYAPGDLVTLAGGSAIRRTVLSVTNTKLLSVTPAAAGTGYVPADTIAVTGGTQTTPVQLTVATTKVSAVPGIAVAGAGGTPGTATVTGTTGTGTRFQATVTIDGAGAIASVDALTVAGSYTVNPAVLANEPVTGGGLAGAELSIVMGVNTVTITNAGVFTANPTGAFFTQASTSGAGTGATFQFALMGPNAVTVSVAGIYPDYPVNPVAQRSTTGLGLGATFTVTTTAVVPLVNGDWVVLSGMSGMRELNGGIFVIANVTATTFSLRDVYGNNIDSTTFSAYLSGGTAARIYTLSTPYNEADIQWLKWTQDDDVMTICCLNQNTNTEYEVQELVREANNEWTIADKEFGASIDPPASGTAVESAAGATDYQYVITSVSREDGSESVASPILQADAAVNIAATAGTITLTWDQVDGASIYNVYKCTPGLNSTPIPVGVQFGFAGQARGTQFIDTNIVPDFQQVPPLATDPFARGRILDATITTEGSGYTTASVTIITSTGSEANLQAAIVGGAVKFILIKNPGHDYAETDLIRIDGDGIGATATMTVGPSTGTYPSTVAYLQQRLAFANTLNQPDTYFLSQPGAFGNFDRRIPTIDSDAITGNPFSVQLNGIQWIVNMPGGGVVLSGREAWQLTGSGGSSFTPQPITPSTQQAQPQAYNGCHPHIPPIKIDYDILYVQQKGSIIRNLSYQTGLNIYTGVDMTLNSPQLFTEYTIREWAWCEEPYKVAWAIREEDGSMLSLTFVKPQEVAGWARHDTQGRFVSCCSVTEPLTSASVYPLQPISENGGIDALYIAAQRFPAPFVQAYMIERMNDRLWQNTEGAWCVDAGLFLAQSTPAATLWASSATGLGSITGVTSLVGGSGYSAATTATIKDENVTNNGPGPGAGATASLTIAAGVITAVTITAAGSGYLHPMLEIYDPANTGTGASARLTLNNETTFAASAGVFAPGDVVSGKVIRMGGGVATLTQFVSATEVRANITTPIVSVVPGTDVVMESPPGTWTMTEPVTTVSGLLYLAGATVTGLYDGKVIPPTVVPANGIITLPEAASQVLVGLGFTAELQTLYTDPPGVTTQARRKKNAAVTARIEASGPFLMGANQPDGSVQNPIQIAPTWQGMVEAPTAGPGKAITPYNSSTLPLFTGDVRVPLGGGYDVKGQAAFQQTQPLPLTILSAINELVPGDMPEDEPERRRRGNRGMVADG